MKEKDFYEERLLGNDNYKVFIPESQLVKRAKIDENGYNNGNTLELLQNDYPEIYEAIKKENYYIDSSEKYFYFFKIPNEKAETIGFATFTIYDEKSIIMNQIYVLPEYRGHKHFIATYNYFCELLPEAEIFVRNPSRSIIDNIIEADYCYLLKDRFVMSHIFFVYDQAPFKDTLNYTNKTYNETGNLIKFITETNLYDLNIDALVSLSPNSKEYKGTEDLLKIQRSTISLVRDEDEKRFNILKKRREDPWIQKGNYFKKVFKIFQKEKIKIKRDK